MRTLDAQKFFEMLVFLFPPRPAQGVEVDSGAFVDFGDHIHLCFRLGRQVITVVEPLPPSFFRFRPDAPVQGKLADALDAWFTQESVAWAESIREAINQTLRRLAFLVSVGEANQKYYLPANLSWSKASLEKIEERESFNLLGIRIWLSHKNPTFASASEEIIALKDFLTPMEMDLLWEACKPDSSSRGYKYI